MKGMFTVEELRRISDYRLLSGCSAEPKSVRQVLLALKLRSSNSTYRSRLERMVELGWLEVSLAEQARSKMGPVSLFKLTELGEEHLDVCFAEFGPAGDLRVWGRPAGEGV